MFLRTFGRRRPPTKGKPYLQCEEKYINKCVFSCRHLGFVHLNLSPKFTIKFGFKFKNSKMKRKEKRRGKEKKKRIKCCMGRNATSGPPRTSSLRSPDRAPRCRQAGLGCQSPVSVSTSDLPDTWGPRLHCSSSRPGIAA